MSYTNWFEMMWEIEDARRKADETVTQTRLILNAHSDPRIREFAEGLGFTVVESKTVPDREAYLVRVPEGPPVWSMHFDPAIPDFDMQTFRSQMYVDFQIMMTEPYNTVFFEDSPPVRIRWSEKKTLPKPALVMYIACMGLLTYALVDKIIG
jgi:hypothetical protein